jgi:hypothetical protein
MNSTTVPFITVFCLFALSCEAQQLQVKLSPEEMSVTIDSISQILQKNYIFPEVGGRMVQSLKSNLKQGKYSSSVDPAGFARQLTQDLQLISKDKHLRVVYDPCVIAEELSVTAGDRAKVEEQWVREMKANNFGFQEIKILEGNIGYLDLREFANPKYARETAVAAMNKFASVEALIVDLRNNGGGSPEMVQLISSYLFSSVPVHLNDIYDGPTKKTTEYWTFREVPGTRRPDMDVYVLTSRRTFSAAEEFSYNLKQLKRATLIGETTGGGAHPTGSVIATDKFFVRVPKGRAINPLTHTNWEGTGVTPDIAVSSYDALDTALAKALEKK